YLPPEYQPGAPGGAPSPVMDSYAVAAMLYWGALSSSESSSRPPDAPLDGLDKAQLLALKDQVHNRLKAEQANPRFHTRLSDQTAALLNRALSRQVKPSPPYRFQDLTAFQQRISRLQALVHPRVEHVGKILLDRPPGSETYTTDEEVVFSCTIGCTPGVESHEEVSCGLALFDRDTDARIRKPKCIYTASNHPSGRLRFGFRLTDIPPGSYRVRVAFTIHDSHTDPMLAEGRFECRPAPGYVPPPINPAARRPIPLQRPEDDPITQTQAALRPQPADVSTGPDQAEADPSMSGASVRAGVQLGGPATVHQLGTPARAATLPPLQPPPRDEPGSEVDRPDPFGSEPTSPRISLKPTRTRPIHTSMAPPPAEEDPYDFPEEGRGTWEPELPAPSFDDSSIYEDDEDDDWTDEQLPSGPIGDLLGRLVELVRGDAYVMFIGGAAVVIMLLIGLLWALR
ncbi:MAG: hypothetical protein ACI8S6_005984, partial [Myxococcota bacterium]